MKFKCNFCPRTIEVRVHGPEKIVCYCGAKYKKVVTAAVVDDNEESET